MKRILLLTVLLLACLLFPALAEGPEVFVADEAAGIPQELIDRLAADHPDAGAIHILRWACPAGDEQPPSPAEEKIIVTSRSAMVKDLFLITSAKGSIKSLLDDMELAACSEVLPQEGSPAPGQLGIEGCVSILFPKGTVFPGPAENSPYNSREYRVCWYGCTGKYQSGTVSATWTQPIGTILYALDRFILP